MVAVQAFGEAAERERDLADDDHGLMGQWVCSYWQVRRRQRCIQAKVRSTTQR
jgi:hypothetical protein